MWCAPSESVFGESNQCVCGMEKASPIRFDVLWSFQVLEFFGKIINFCKNEESKFFR